MAAATTSTKSDATAGSPAGQQVTILRIKRKRTEEPLEALFSATTLPTIFRLAETVEEKSFHSPSEAQKLKDRITRRLQAVHRAQVPESLEERKDKTVEKQMSGKCSRKSSKGYVPNV
ncbi:uncharacterized protein BYT42DRAFT_487800 [Radiomyces spectabilis]|uniref:uncharacterized protein n=1 Tax=Radiomyces spectabilis TaxID=64574 RepID=UPI00221E5DA7|nr:uncharacterized protein BYT42DRAFT_487800 [Radiomyces spectabilis]KAI8393342.1 hypothetical protein BYT42DRAFT_487800 [Radiomyces spectabilis]